jgi:dynein heavy chain
MSKWDAMVPAYVAPVSRKFSEILVPTVDTVRYSWLLEQIMGLKKPACFCGDSGSAKTVTVYASFAKLDAEKFQTLNINMSSRTSAADFKFTFNENIDKKTFKQYGPKSAGKRMIVFIDDMNMPKIDVYGTQQPLALGLFLIARSQLYHQTKDDLELREIVDTQFVGCISPESKGGNRVDPRLMSLFSVFHVTFPTSETT